MRGIARDRNRLWAEIKDFLFPVAAIATFAIAEGFLELFELVHAFDRIHEAFAFAFLMSLALFLVVVRKSIRLNREILARRAAEHAAQMLARHDPLTGLANRRVMLERLQGGINHARQRSIEFSVLLIDLDRFKPINDTYGHEAGDFVLCEVALLLKTIMPANSTVARLGGDEFAVILPSEIDKQNTIRLAQRLITALSTPFVWSTSELRIGATVGISSWPLDGADPEALLRAADMAMYCAKKEGRGHFRSFEKSMDDELQARVSIESELRVAIAKGQICPHYQPLVSLQDRSIYGLEILARWNHPTRGLILPESFISLAEDAGLISEISYQLLRRACLDAKNWPPDLTLAINISPIQLKDLALPERLLWILTETGFAPGRLEVEVTETALVTDFETARAILSSLRNVGIRIVLDDFGTGYSSLYHLRGMIFDKIKIDQSFIQSMHDSDQSKSLVKAVIAIGHSLGLPTTAEGVEELDQMNGLAAYGCDFAQGYLFARPAPADEISTLFSGTGRTKDLKASAA